MITQLLLSKRLFLEGSEFARRHDAVSCGIAISLFQDSVEMLVWALIKTRGITIKDGSPFTANLELLQKDGVSIPETPRLLELNRARVGFKHYGNLPAPDEARKFHSYVEDFLRSITANYFNQNFEEISLVDIVPFPGIRTRLKVAEAHIAKSEFSAAVREASIAKEELFQMLDKYIPRVDNNLKSMDEVLKRADNSGFIAFRYLEKYLRMLREATLVSLLHLPLDDYVLLSSTLFSASRSIGEKWTTTDTNIRGAQYDEAVCKRQIACLVNISIRLEGVV